MGYSYREDMRRIEGGDELCRVLEIEVGYSCGIWYVYVLPVSVPGREREEQIVSVTVSSRAQTAGRWRG